jgi:hypothetical protein
MLVSKPTAAQRLRSALTPLYQSFMRRSSALSDSARDIRVAHEGVWASLI